MLSTSASHSHFSFNRNGDAAHQSSNSYDFLPSVSFDDLHSSIQSSSSDFKLAQFPSPTGTGSILDSKGKVVAKPSDKMSSVHAANASNRAYIPSSASATTITTRPARSSSIIGKPSTSTRQPSTSSIASSWSASGDGLTAPAPVRPRRQSQYPPVSNVTAAAKPPRKSMGPGILVDSDTYSSAQRRRPSIISDRGGSDSTRASIDGSDATRPFNASRAAKAKSVQPPPRVAQPGLSAYGVESNRLSLAARSPRLNANNRAGLNTSSAANKRASMMPGTGHSAHASGLGARTISPTDTRRMKRMSMMPPPPQPLNHAGNIQPPPPVSMDNRSASRSPSLNPRKPSLTPSSARTTPDHSRKSHTSGLSVGSTGSFTFGHQTSANATQARGQPQASGSRLPAPKTGHSSHTSSSQNEEDEDVPPVPAIPKVYESPKDNAPAGPYFLDKKRSALSSVETLSIHSNSTGSISLPAPPEPAKPKRRPSARKSTMATSGKEEKQTGQSRRHLQPLTLPPLNLAPLSIPTAAKVAALQDQPAKEPRSSPPPTRHVPKTPTTPMTASKSSFFQNRYDDSMELPALRSSSTVHHSHRKNRSPPDAGSSDSSSIIIQEPNSKYSISPYLSSSLPRGGFSFSGHKRSKASGDYSTVTGNLTEGQNSKKPGARSIDTTKYTPKSPGPAPTPDEPPTPSSISSLRRKLSLSWKRSASKNHGDVHDTGDKSSTEVVPRLPKSTTVNNLYNAKTRSPTISAATSTTNEQRTRKSSAQSLTMLPHSKSESWGNRKDSDDYSHMKPISRIVHSTHKSLKPKSSSTTLRQTGAYSANELDKDDLAANEEMRKMGSRRKETDIAARTLDALKRRATPKERVGPQEAIRIAMLNIYERGEIIDYSDVYFCGTQSARKVVGDLQSGSPNFGYDDERGDYTIVAGDHLAYRYEIVDVLGKGSFGQVLRCIDHKLGKLVAIKIIRNKKRFHQQALVEVNILQKLREWDPHDKHSMVSFTQSFYFRGHLCISTELLDMNLYEFIKAHSFRGFSLKIIRRFTKQILSSLILLKQRKIIHCDLKPENILLKHPLHSELKVIDFGSSCFENEKVYTYIQSRFYRSPEVILGMTYGLPIDMWSVGCILAELFTGVPIFPGENEQEQLACIMEVFGPPEKHLIEKSTRKKLFFDSMGKPRLTVSSKGRRRRPSSKTLQQAIKCDDEAFVDFLARCLRWDPDRRLKPEDAVHHEFITGQKMPPAPRMPTRESSPVKRNNTITMSRPLPDPPKTLGMMRTVPSPIKGAVALNAASRRASGATGATAASLSRRTSAGPGSVTSSSSGLPRITARSTSGKPDLAAAGASAAMNRRA
ncbi:Protein kinase-like domain protein [Cordyceps fumosorosea ARSEF 2679]|uniref:Protein kinase-like domain protein n=1 Tax=Cordyceps fumosorosea (strain ARSEF 2679) TaxID=1081104 RepID=A0A167R4D5_CORFA|nr:Protein kinase-like domain protein [Cordyceps fumosorosea ARSEF 2679]OAA58260.1 Protein kinase-like domain protein [Cordyceps fumosorosea ARSEF 2679]